MSARRWWKPWTWLRREPEVRHLTDLVDADAWAADPRAALLEAALLARRAGLVFALVSVLEVEALARAREQLELERAAVLEALLRDFAAAIARGSLPAPAADDEDVARLLRARARKGAA